MTQISDPALSLLGAIVQQNVDDLAFTTDRIIESLDREISYIGGVLADVIDAIDDALVIDNKTQARLRSLDPRIAAALDIHHRKMVKS